VVRGQVRYLSPSTSTVPRIFARASRVDSGLYVYDVGSGSLQDGLLGLHSWLPESHNCGGDCSNEGNESARESHYK